MNALGMQTAGDLRRFERGELLNHFGRYGYRLYDLARGIDERPVKAERERPANLNRNHLARRFVFGAGF